MTLPDLRAAIATAPTAELPDVIGELEACKAIAWARLTGRSDPHQIGADAARNDVVDVATLSAELDVAPSWLRAQARANKLPHLRCGKYIKFRRADVLAALERSGTDHKMGHPVDAEKLNDGAAPFPPVSKLDSQNGRGKRPVHRPPTTEEGPQ